MLKIHCSAVYSLSNHVLLVFQGSYLRSDGPVALRRGPEDYASSWHARVGSVRPDSARTAGLQLHGGSAQGESCTPLLPARHSANKNTLQSDTSNKI